MAGFTGTFIGDRLRLSDRRCRGVAVRADGADRDIRRRRSRRIGNLRSRRPVGPANDGGVANWRRDHGWFGLRTWRQPTMSWRGVVAELATYGPNRGGRAGVASTVTRAGCTVAWMLIAEGVPHSSCIGWLERLFAHTQSTWYSPTRMPGKVSGLVPAGTVTGSSAPPVRISPSPAEKASGSTSGLVPGIVPYTMQKRSAPSVLLVIVLVTVPPLAEALRATSSGATAAEPAARSVRGAGAAKGSNHCTAGESLHCCSMAFTVSLHDDGPGPLSAQNSTVELLVEHAAGGEGDVGEEEQRRGLAVGSTRSTRVRTFPDCAMRHTLSRPCGHRSLNMVCALPKDPVCP